MSARKIALVAAVVFFWLLLAVLSEPMEGDGPPRSLPSHPK